MTELIWDGKYKDGKKQGPVRIALPFQTIETVNEGTEARLRSLELFASGRETGWRNRLIWGDKKYVLPSLLPEFAGKVNLIYIDPPFDTGADFSFTATIPEQPNSDRDETTSFTKEPSILEQKAYRDTWGRGLDSYLQWFCEAVVLLRELLHESGCIYVHLDWHIGHYAKAVLDEIFGQEQFKNEIIWKRSLPHNDPKKYGAIHDALLWYVKSASYVFNQNFTGLSEEYKESHYTQTDESGRRYQLTSLAATGAGPSRRFGKMVLEPPPGTHWRYKQETIDELIAAGRIIFT
ncbi:MAG TPA: DNA methyltransferase, partial [Terriglobia bacterium]|nr:DNA methyltransferase [Terriglobia bacterium]